jgi:hypothetical protein
MRSLKLVPALAIAAATSLALLAAGASAAPHARHAKHHQQAIRNGSCRLSLLAAPRFVLAGESATLRGTLLCARAPVSNQTVTILQRSAGSAGLTTVGTPMTNTSGFFELASGPLSSNSTFYASAVSAHSAHRAVKVMPKVTLASPTDGAQLFTGPGAFKTRGGNAVRNVVRFTGTVSPADAGATVVLQRENTVGIEEWHRIAVGVVDRNGNYSIAHKFATPGDANIRIVVRPSANNAIGASEAFSYEISQAQNPALLIEPSANPLIYGQPVTISGKAVSGPAATLTLLARTRAQSAFAPVATTVSGPGGAYSFTQTPLQSTLYRVASGATKSATIFEGVKYAVTAAPSAGSVEVGQPLTVSGKVTPAVANHPIYLQVLNPAGIGYHLIQAGIVDGMGNYSITHRFFNATISPRTLRVKIPGDPQNQGAASQSFQVALTPASGPLLRPEPPANSSQPHEGQV